MPIENCTAYKKNDRYTYNARNQIVELTNICDECEWVVSTYRYTYDDRGFIASETAIESLAGYAYDDKHNGRHTDGKHDELYPHGTKHAKHDKDATFAYQIVETDRTFTYDAAGKLVSATETEDNYGTYIYTYEYDLMGNRTYMEKTLNGTVAEWHKYEYNESNQLVSEQLYNGKKTTSLAYTYDADGNRITETGKIGTDKVEKTYEYTVENRLSAVYDGDELLLAAAYDGDGNRVFQLNYNLHTDEDWKGNSGTGNGSNKDNSGSGSNGNATNAEEDNSQNQSGILFPIEEEVSDTEQTLIDKIKTTGKQKNYELIEYLNDVNREYAEVLVEQNINGKTDTSYVYGVERLSLDRFDGSTGYYLYDPRGSVTGITNEEGQVYQSYRYSVTGEITFGAPQYENEYTYNAESYNPNIESQYLRARYYCVVTADFLTEDSYLGDITEPLTLNRYNYCVGSYLNYVDPSGNVEINIPLEEIENAETMGDMFGLLSHYTLIKCAEIEAEHEAREQQVVENMRVFHETTGVKVFTEVESAIGLTGIYNLLVSPLRYSYQGKEHPFLETIVNRQENAKSMYVGIGTFGFDIIDQVKHPELLTSRIYGSVFAVVDNPDLLFPDLMEQMHNAWYAAWECDDETFFTKSGYIGTEILVALGMAGVKKCLDEKISTMGSSATKGGSYASPNNIDNLLDGRPELTGSTRDKLLSTIQDSELSKVVNELYRPGATVGDGGTAAILVEEFNNGSSTHLIKATERLKQLRNLESSGKLSLNDLDIVEALIDDLEYSIGLFE